MGWADAVNGLFEVVGGLAVWVNVYQVRRDRRVRGVHPWTYGFFLGWGLWNLVFYPAVGAWFSFWGGASICAAQAVWVGYAVKYRRG